MKKTVRQMQKEQTKEVLLKTAYDLFSRQGILNTRMSDIAQAAGVSHGTVFLHFDTQEAFISEVVAFYCGKIALRTHQLAEPCSSLRELLSAHLEGIMEFEPFYARLVIENRLLPTSARDEWINLQSAISFHFGRAVEREFFPGDLSPAMLFNMWMGLVHYYIANGDLFAPDGNVMQRYGSTLTDSYLKLISYKKEGDSIE